MVDNYFVRLPGGPSEPVAPAPASPYVGGDYKVTTAFAERLAPVSDLPLCLLTLQCWVNLL